MPVKTTFGPFGETIFIKHSHTPTPTPATSGAGTIPTVPQGTTGATGTAETPFSQTFAGITFQAEQQKSLLTIQAENAATLAKQQQVNALAIQKKEQAFQSAQLERRLEAERQIRIRERERERLANIAQLRAERQDVFGQLLASGDQARAVIFALGFGPENDAFNVRARSLGTTIKELKGARQLERTTEAALSGVLGRSVDIGREGVRGLGTIISSARAFAQGGVDIQTLLASAFGVGSLREGEQPGVSRERLEELVTSVTPTGVL